MLRSSTAQCIAAHGAGAVCRIATWILAAVFRSIRCIHEFSVVAALGHLDVLPFCCQARHQSRARVHCRVSGGKQSPSEPLGGYVHALSKLRQCWRPWRLLCPPRERHGDLSGCRETKHDVYSVRGFRNPALLSQKHSECFCRAATVGKNLLSKNKYASSFQNRGGGGCPRAQAETKGRIGGWVGVLGLPAQRRKPARETPPWRTLYGS